MAVTSGLGTPSPFVDPNESLVREVSIKLLREILDYQQRLDALGTEEGPLAAAYRNAIRVRREMLRDLPLTANTRSEIEDATMALAAGAS